MKPFMKNMVDEKKWISISSGSLLPGIISSLSGYLTILVQFPI